MGYYILGFVLAFGFCMCFGKSFATTRRQLLCRRGKRSKARKDDASDGSIFTTMQIITKEIALDQKNGLGRSEPNQFPYLPPPEGRVEFSILNPGQMLTDIVGQRQYKKCCRLCKTFACFFVFLGIFFIVAYYYQPLKDSLCFILYGNMTCQSTISSSLSNVRL